MIAYNKIDKRFYNIKFSYNKTWRYITYYENGFGWSHSYVSDENMEKDWFLPQEGAESYLDWGHFRGEWEIIEKV